MIDVTCGIIRNEDNEVLIVQRGEKTDHPFKWEFPGGKTNHPESNEDCIIREISEELSIDIVICGQLKPVEYDYGHKQIRLIPFICDTLEEFPVLTEHLAYKWIDKEEFTDVDFSEADVIVAQQYLSVTEVRSGKEIDPAAEEQQSTIDDADLQIIINNMMSRQEAEWMATSAIENPAIFKKLLEYSYSEDKKLAFRASWTLTKVCDRYPELIYPFLTEIVESLDKIDNESVQRSFLRIISMNDMKKFGQKYHGILADHCFRLLHSGFSAIAIKAYSMEIIYKLAIVYPELANELSATINMLQGEGSAGVIARGHLIMKKLAEITLDSKSSRK
jgi:8-oxo-dGTP diphosphatase